MNNNYCKTKKYCSFCLFTLIVLILATSQLKAQVLKRIEFDEEKEYRDRNVVIPLQDKGLIYLAVSNELLKMRIDYYSTDLIKTGTQSFKVERNIYYYNSVIQNDTLYALFLNNTGFYGVLITNLKTTTSTFVSGLLPRNTFVFQFAVISNFGYIRGVIGKEDALLQINLSTKKVKIIPVVIPNYRPNKVFPQEIQVVGDKLLYLVNVKNIKNDLDLLMLQADKDGKFGAPIDISTDMPAKIVTVKADIINDKVLLAGTYSTTRHNYSQGALFAELKGNSILFPEFYSFLDMKSFNLIFSEREQKAVDRKQENASDKNNTLVVNTQSLLHDIKQARMGYYLLIEFYQTYYYKGAVAGYNTTHGIVMKFDDFGKLEWDGGIEIKIDANELYHLLSASESETGDITIAFSDKHKIKSRTFDNSGKLKSENVLDLEKTDKENIKNAKRTRSQVDSWYENYFVTWGIQLFKGPDKGKVFFIDKLAIE